MLSPLPPRRSECGAVATNDDPPLLERDVDEIHYKGGVMYPQAGIVGGLSVLASATATNVPSREPAMVQEVGRIDERISRILQLTQQLHVRLETVLRPEPTSPASPDKDSSSGVPILRWAQDKSRQLALAMTQLESILKRLEI